MLLKYLGQSNGFNLPTLLTWYQCDWEYACKQVRFLLLSSLSLWQTALCCGNLPSGREPPSMASVVSATSIWVAARDGETMRRDTQTLVALLTWKRQSSCLHSVPSRQHIRAIRGGDKKKDSASPEEDCRLGIVKGPENTINWTYLIKAVTTHIGKHVGSLWNLI